MAEKNILAYFKSPEEAEQAAQKLSELGVVDLSIDRISRYSGQGTERMMNTLGGELPSLASTVLDADITNRGAGILLAADVSASGMSDGGQDDITGRDILLTVVVEEPKHHQALHIVEQSGGMQ
ncbi:hypothetical protein AM501_30115 [Aneurinibacillus migulanus]|nr:hypothetical protein [Aneurinibacillus migulanus]KIV50668.1 hypothetical protein TS65_29710 [Aneurinibacillus migulanus]KIV53235.1 hypothetical protein TS64_19820 [Aneurinibacillus migulanus]KON97480.1 hypothetical protein AF333_20415 [Aneurinibacillus migulanus]KPD04746.1 hypothetical protein AM501_30115 [Aneurinibacillus migulanus]MCP1358694.1 hypothetical protein [Aneurinibacillus migulanus]